MPKAKKVEERQKEKDANSSHVHKDGKHEQPPITWFAAVSTYFGYAILVVFGHVRDFLGKRFVSRYFESIADEDYASLVNMNDNFYTRRLYHRIQDCWNRPIRGSPGSWINVLPRITKDGNKTLNLEEWSGKTGESTAPKRCLNLGSYNYLGFADDWNITCKKDVLSSFEKYNVSTSSSSIDLGSTAIHKELEERIAKFVGKPAAVVFNMGYGTNFSSIPALMGKGSLIISDSLNHASIVNGGRASGATIRVFRHNDPINLEELLREAIADGQPRTHRPWTKILVMVEGVYSMEGEICNLPPIVAVCKKYKAYIYMDEAHSIGAVGPHGKGVCDFHNVDPADIDILMGTFTKSFGAMGGYVAASEEFITAIKQRGHGSLFSSALSPIICQQIISALMVITGEDGTNIGQKKLDAVINNSNYFRDKLIEMGCDVFGETGSPIVPLMLYNPTKIAAFSRECFKRNLAVVVVGFPATPLVSSRARFCISAGHKKEDIDMALEKIGEVTELLKLRYRNSTFG